MKLLGKFGGWIARRSADESASNAANAAAAAQRDAAAAAQSATQAKESKEAALAAAEAAKAVTGETSLPEGIDDLYLYYTQRAGELCRQLSLGAIGAIWLIRPSIRPGEDLKPLPQLLGFSLMLIVTSLALDAFQYIVGLFFLYASIGDSQQHFRHHKKKLILMLVFLTAKVVAVLVGCCLLSVYAWPILITHGTKVAAGQGPTAAATAVLQADTPHSASTQH